MSKLWNRGSIVDLPCQKTHNNIPGFTPVACIKYTVATTDEQKIREKEPLIQPFWLIKPLIVQTPFVGHDFSSDSLDKY